MRTKICGGIGALVSVAAGVGAADAADLAVKGPVYAAPPAILSDWAGFYIGINGGGGWASTSLDAPLATPSFFAAKSSGGVFGVQAGYNWQVSSFVFGGEVDFDGGGISGTLNPVGLATKTDELGSVRARAGYTFLPNLLAYGTVGFAYGRTRVGVPVPITPTIVATTPVAQNGWTAGAGLEYKVWGPWIARGEYLHYGLDGDGINLGPSKLKTDIDVVRGGLSYKF